MYLSFFSPLSIVTAEMEGRIERRREEGKERGIDSTINVRQSLGEKDRERVNTDTVARFESPVHRFLCFR